MLLELVSLIYGTLIAASKLPKSSSSNSTVISFDDIPTSFGLGGVPASYNHLSFSSYSVLTPHDPALKGWISPNDLNCAVSAPNALIGSRPGNPNPWVDSGNGSTHVPSGAYFSIANASSMLDVGLEPYFTLLSFNIKPMDAPLPGTTLFVAGYSHTRNETDPFRWHVEFPSGYHLPLPVNMSQYSGETWTELYGVEILADFGEQALDWEFCIDDLELMFFAKSRGKEVQTHDIGAQAPIKVVR